jgi:AraC-like DNA-binding protein
MGLGIHAADGGAVRFRTSDPSACRAYFRATQDGMHDFDVSREPSFQNFAHHEWPVGRVSLNLIELHCADSFTITKSAPSPWYQFNFLLEGQCELRTGNRSILATAGDAFVVDPDQIGVEVWESGMSQYLLRVDRRVIEHALATELGSAVPRQRPIFDPLSRDPGIGSWLQHIAKSGINATDSLLLTDRRVLRSIEQALVTMVLSGFHHSASEDLARQITGIAPYYVKRAEEYIRVHACNDLTIDDIAAAARVSARTLFYGFKRWRGKSPMAYVRDTRLDLARRELERGQEHGGSVSRAAINAGFTNFSQFSRIYKARFGETPSATLLGH